MATEVADTSAEMPSEPADALGQRAPSAERLTDGLQAAPSGDRTLEQPAVSAAEPHVARARSAPASYDGRLSPSPRISRLRLPWSVLTTLLVAAALCLITFLAGGGLNLATRTPVEIVLTLVCGVGIAAAILLAPAPRPTYGIWSIALLLALAALSALSAIWSVEPDGSWQDAGRLFAYAALFAFAALWARAAPMRWPSIVGGALLAAVVVCGYALLTKVFPDAIGVEQSAGHAYARLQAPYGYWNATGLAAALGAIGCLWLGARREGHALWNALAYPAMGLMLVTLMLAYSRGALAALAIGVALWLCLVPLRLRGAAVLGVGALGAGVVVAWDFSQHALTTDDVPLAERVLAGHQLGVLLAAMLVLMTLAGVAIGFLTDRARPLAFDGHPHLDRGPGPPALDGGPESERSGETHAPGEHRPFRGHLLSPAARRRAGAALLALPAIAVIALLGALTVSHRGLFGSVSHTVSTLTNPNAPLPANGPGRLTALGSVRARYWNEALEVFRDHPLLGAGAEGYETARLRYRTAPIDVGQAHGFIVQTLADLGVIGLLLVLALLWSWLAAAGHATHPFNRRWTSWRELRAGTRPGWRALPPEDRPRLYGAERVGLLTLVCVVATFGVHSFVDWTWYVPGVACAALLCAGWVAGRGPLAAPAMAMAAPAVSQAPTKRLNRPARELPRRRTPRSWAPALREVSPWRGAIAAAVVISALLAAWAQWQPQRSADASDEALALVGAGRPAAASAAAHAAVGRDPLSAKALLTLAAVQEGAGHTAGAATAYEHAVHLQPANYRTWQALGEYDLRTGQPRAALLALRAAVYLNPQAVAPRAQIADNAELLSIQDAYLQALRQTAGGGGTAAQ